MSTEGLQFYNLSHQVGHNMVQWPSPFSKPFVANRLYYHAMHDFYAVEYDGIMHRGTHMDTPAHVEPDQPYLDGFDVWRFFGTGWRCPSRRRGGAWSPPRTWSGPSRRSGRATS